MRITAFLLAGLTTAQSPSEYEDSDPPQYPDTTYGDYNYIESNYADTYNYYAAEATTSPRPKVGTTEPVAVTTAPTDAPTEAVTAAATEAPTEAPFLALDAVEVASEEVEEVQESAFDPR